MKNSAVIENRVLFLLLLAFEICHLFYLVLSHRMPIGHDGFQYFSMQYFFLNDSAINGEVPLWVPYMNHGITATWWYTMQGSINILTNALLLTGRMIASINFLDLFHYGIFVDRLLLLIGVWLLGQRYFESAWTRFFVACCVMGSTVTMTQFNFTLHFYYAIPLLLYLVHTFLETGRWRYFFLASNLFMIQTFGKNADTAAVISLTVFLYFLFCDLDGPRQFCQQIKNLRWGLPSAAAIAGSLLSLGVLVAIFLAGRDPAMVSLNAGRGLDASVPLNIFLTYAGNMDFQKWLELILRLSPSLDFTVYMGFLALPLIFYGLILSPLKAKNPIVLVSLVLLFFSMGTWVSVFFYYTWPMMKFYRHLALIVPIIKLFLLFLAGFGFERIFIHPEIWQGKKIISYSCLLVGALLLEWSMVLVEMSKHGFNSSLYIVAHLTVQTSQTPSTFDAPLVSLRLAHASFWALLTAIIFFVLPLLPIKKWGRAIILVVVLMNAADIGGYYFTEINERTSVLNKNQYKITAFAPMPYVTRRTIASHNPREKILSTSARLFTLYSTVNAFLFQDALATRYRTIVRLKPLHDLVGALGKDIVKNKAFLKIAGSSEDKIQFFNRAYFCADERQIASDLKNPNFQADTLLLSGSSAGPDQCHASNLLTANNRVHLPYQILKFTPNSLELSVDNPFKQPVWMMYADVWHKDWSAQVNGIPAAVFKADLAYKAVLLMPGQNNVRFLFNAPMIVWLEKIIAINSLLWLAILLYLMTRICSYTLDRNSTHVILKEERPNCAC